MFARWMGEAIFYLIGLPLFALQAFGMIDAVIDLLAYLAESMRFKS